MSNINLLPWREELQRRRNSSFYMSAGIAFVIAALIGAVAWWYADQLVQQEQSRIDRLNQEIVKLDAKLETINGLKAEIDSMKQRMDTITRLQESRNQAVHLLNDLPTFVGSGVYLDKVSLSNGKVAFLWSLLLFILSGILGWVMLQTPISSGISLMCTFSGLFGISTILFSLNDSSSIPHQNKYYDLFIDRDAIKSIFAGGTAGAILGFLPGFGPAQGSIIAQGACGASDESDDTKNFLLANSGLNTSDTLFSLIAIYLIGNPRSGIAVYMSYLISEFTLAHLMIFTFASLIAVSISLMICLKLGDGFSNLMQGIDYKKLSITVILLMIVILYAFAIIYEGPILYLTLALITTTAMGLLPHYLGVSKSHLMGVLILPAIIIYMQMYI